MLKATFAFLLSILTSSAFGQGLTIFNQPPFSGGALSQTGYSASTGGALFLPTSTNLQSLKAPYTIVFGALVSGYPFPSVQELITNDQYQILNEWNLTGQGEYQFVTTHWLPPTGNAYCGNANVMCIRPGYYTGGTPLIWHSHCIVVTGGTSGGLTNPSAYWYIDGSPVDRTFSGSVTAPTKFWQLANATGGQATGTVQFREMGFWNRALSPAECNTIAALNSANKTFVGNTTDAPGLQVGMVDGWRFDNCNASGCVAEVGSDNWIYDSAPSACSVTTAGGTVSGSVNLQASATDNVGINSVTYKIDNAPLGTSSAGSPWTVAWNTVNWINGAHSATATCINAAGNSLTSSAVNFTVNNATTAKTVFVSGTGSDSNNGLTSSTPIQTCAHLQTFALHGGDTVAFDAANPITITNPTTANSCMFVGTNNYWGVTPNVTGTGTGFPLTITSYGGTGSCSPLTGQTGTCATINVAGTLSTTLWLGIVSVGNLSYVTTKNLIINNTVPAAAQNPNGAHTSGIFYASANGSGGMVGMNVTNNSVIGMPVSIEADGDPGFVGDGALCGGSVTNNLMHGQGVSTFETGGFTTLEWGTTCANVGNPQGLLQGNLIYNLGGKAGESIGNGILLNAFSNNILNQFNVVHDIGANSNSCGGPAGNWDYNSSNIIFQYNETYKVQPVPFPPPSGCDWAGFDIDGGSQHIIYQYNYSHDNAGGGVILFTASVNGITWTDNYVRYHISYNDAFGNESPIGQGTGGSGSYGGTMYIYNNTLINNIGTVANPSTSQFGFTFGGPCLSGVFANNIIYSAYRPGDPNKQANMVSSAGCNTIRFGANDWTSSAGADLWFAYNGLPPTFAGWQAAILGGDAGSITTSPGFTMSDVTCYPGNVIPAGPQNQPSGCPSWVSSPNSTVKGFGVNVNAAPYNVPTSTYGAATSDYFGNPVPNTTGSGYNMGAYGGN